MTTQVRIDSDEISRGSHSDGVDFAKRGEASQQWRRGSVSLNTMLT